MPHHTGDDAAIDAEVEEIRGMNITNGSRGGYERAAAHIILFFFVSAVNLINPIFSFVSASAKGTNRCQYYEVL